jgi:hypothetical protein
VYGIRDAIDKNTGYIYFAIFDVILVSYFLLFPIITIIYHPDLGCHCWHWRYWLIEGIMFFCLLGEPMPGQVVYKPKVAIAHWKMTVMGITVIIRALLQLVCDKEIFLKEPIVISIFDFFAKNLN